MLPDYADIKALTAQAPIWYDSNGVPRYALFKPDMMSIYAQYALLVKIKCQNCTQEFLVGQSWDAISFSGSQIKMNNLPDVAKNFHYGDPPRHDCAGDTMNCIDLAIVEAWKIEHETEKKEINGKMINVITKFGEWERDPAIEALDILSDWAK